MKKECPLRVDESKCLAEQKFPAMPCLEPRNGCFDEELKYGLNAISLSAGEFIEHSIIRLREKGIALDAEKEEFVREVLKQEIMIGIRELCEVPKIIKKGEKDIEQGKKTIDGLAFVYFIKAKEELEKVQVSSKCATALALMSVAPEMKLYTVPGHQIRTAELMEYIKEKTNIDFAFPGLMVMHDFGKAAFNSWNLKGSKDSIIEYIVDEHERRNTGDESINVGIKVLIAEGHACFCHELMQAMKMMCLHKESHNYTLTEDIFRKVLDHHPYTYYGVDPRIKSMTLLADYLDGVMSFREYAMRRFETPEQVRARIKGAFFIDNPYREFGKAAGYTELEAAKLIFGFVERMYGKYMRELFGEDYFTFPKLNERALEQVWKDLEIFRSINMLNKYMKVMVETHLVATKRERKYTAYGIGHVLREARERIK
ncbi:MAG: hypothetical protein QW035_00700 [Candidatus Anstonellales archaeon]